MRSRPTPEPDEQGFEEDLAAAAGREPQLDPAEHARLLEAAAGGDQEAREALARAHLPWVLSAARERADRGLSQGDLFQEGSIGLMEAIHRFPQSGSRDFEAYVRQQVAISMDRALGDEEKAVQDKQRLLQAVHDYVEAELKVRQDLGREPTNTELAVKLEWSAQWTDQIGRMVADARRRHDEELLRYLEPDDIDTIIDDRGGSDDK